jgi:hypothetical protein
MTGRFPGHEPNRGQITSGIAANTLVDRTLEFVRNQIPNWRDDPARPTEESEERLNAQLCKYLNANSRKNFPMVYFHHEEKQTGTRRVDISALPSETLLIEAALHSIYDPFLVFEGKRLPAPTRDREREYVTGGDAKSGGIQRFKLGLHGAKHDLAVLIAYVGTGHLVEWLERVNGWIRTIGPTCAQEKWSTSEQLVGFVEDAKKCMADSTSMHSRIGDVVGPNIRLRHLWVKLAC